MSSLSAKAHSWLDCRNGSLLLEPSQDMLINVIDHSIKTLPTKVDTSQPVIPFVFRKPPNLFPTSSVEKAQETVSKRESQLEGALFADLLKLRGQLASDGGYAPYMIASNKQIIDIAKYRPTSTATLIKIEGFSEKMCERFGKEIVDFVSKYCKDNDLPVDKMTSVKKLIGRPTSTLTATVATSYKAFHERSQSIEEIAKSRNLVAATIEGHLSDAIKSGYPVDIKRAGVTDQIYDQVVAAYKSLNFDQGNFQILPLKQLLPDVSFGKIRIAVAQMERSNGAVIIQETKKESSSQGTKRKSPAWLKSGDTSKRRLKI